MNLYVISLNDSTNRAVSYGIVATTGAAAQAKARELAGVAVDAEVSTFQNLHRVDTVVE